MRSISRFVALRQELDERDLVPDDQAVGAGHAHAAVEKALRIAPR